MTADVADIELRKTSASDLDAIFEHQQDRDANWMAAFTAADITSRPDFDSQWKMRLERSEIINRTIFVEGAIAGHVAKYEREGQPEVTYWIARSFWNRGIATRALRLFLDEIKVAPIHARTAFDNFPSIGVLKKCGFELLGRGQCFANARAREIEEVIWIRR